MACFWAADLQHPRSCCPNILHWKAWNNDKTSNGCCSKHNRKQEITGSKQIIEGPSEHIVIRVIRGYAVWYTVDTDCPIMRIARGLKLMLFRKRDNRHSCGLSDVIQLICSPPDLFLIMGEAADMMVWTGPSCTVNPNDSMILKSSVTPEENWKVHSKTAQLRPVRMHPLPTNCLFPPFDAYPHTPTDSTTWSKLLHCANHWTISSLLQ